MTTPMSTKPLLSATRWRAVTTSSATSPATYASSSRRAPPDYGKPTNQIAAMVAEPAARSKSGRRGRAGITRRLVLTAQDGGVRPAERATPRAREVWRLAPRRPGGVRVRRAVVLPNTTRLPAQGSISLGLRLGVLPSALAPPAIAAGYAHQDRVLMCTRITRAGSRCVSMPQDSKWVTYTTVTRASTCKTYYGHAE